MTRREAREVAFSLLFEFDFNMEKLLDDIIETALEERGVMTDEFSRELLEYAVENFAAIDKEIDRCLIGRSGNRLTKASRAIMRLAVAELMLGKTPSAVVINEAVELAKGFDGDEMPAYVNGVLGTIVKNLEEKRG